MLYLVASFPHFNSNLLNIYLYCTGHSEFLSISFLAAITGLLGLWNLPGVPPTTWVQFHTFWRRLLNSYWVLYLAKLIHTQWTGTQMMQKLRLLLYINTSTVSKAIGLSTYSPLNLAGFQMWRNSWPPASWAKFKCGVRELGRTGIVYSAVARTGSGVITFCAITLEHKEWASPFTGAGGYLCATKWHHLPNLQAEPFRPKMLLPSLV